MTVTSQTVDQHLEKIRGDLLAMVDVVVTRVDEVTAALLERDVARADSLLVGDGGLFALNQHVEELCVEVLLTAQPADDTLRAVVGALHINGEIEQACDLTNSIAKAVGRLQGSRVDDRIRELIVAMGREASHVIGQAVDAFARLDFELAASIDELDDVLDHLHANYVRAVIRGATHGALHPQQSLQLALVGRYYERIGDHAERIGERTRFVIDGRSVRGDGVPSGPDLSRLGVGERVAPNRGLAVIDSIAEERRIDTTRRDFVANVSHELKTPIGAIALLAETLADAGPDDDRARLTDHITREVKRVGDIIDDLLELTRLEESVAEVGPVSIDEVVHQALDVVRGLAGAHDIELRVSGLPSGVTVEGEQRQLVRALVNLIDNAIRYSEPRSAVLVEVDRLVGEVEITVSDTGVGIPRPELERIFERFYRVDRARSRDTGGTGLGLSIVRHVVDNHQGRVLVESKVGAGSTFSLQLPLAEPSPREQAV